MHPRKAAAMLSPLDAANAGFNPARMVAAVQHLQHEIDRGHIPGVVLLVARHGTGPEGVMVVPSMWLPLIVPV